MRHTLILTTSIGKGRAPLVEDMARSLAEAGELVTLAAVDWASQPGQPTRRTTEGAVTTILTSPVGGGSLGKWLLSSLKLRMALSVCGPFDRSLVFAPALPLWACRAVGRTRILYVTDHFPFHNAKLGRVPTRVVGALAALETICRRQFTHIGVMSEANRQFLSEHYRISPQVPIFVTCPWGSPEKVEQGDVGAIRQRYGLPSDRKIALFGGQIELGRGIPELLSAARLAVTRAPDLHFLFVGDGTLAPTVEKQIAERHGNCTLLQPLELENYRQLATAFDVGIIATASDVAVPSFPSKVIDYVRCGIPVVALVQPPSDFGEFIERLSIGIATADPAGDRILASIYRALESIEMEVAGAYALREVFDVNRARLAFEF